MQFVPLFPTKNEYVNLGRSTSPSIRTSSATTMPLAVNRRMPRARRCTSRRRWQSSLLCNKSGRDWGFRVWKMQKGTMLADWRRVIVAVAHATACHPAFAAASDSKQRLHHHGCLFRRRCCHHKHRLRQLRWPPPPPLPLTAG